MGCLCWRGPAKREKKKNLRNRNQRKPSWVNSIASVFTIVPVIPLKGSREVDVTTTPGWGLEVVRLTSQVYWPVAPVVIGADKAGGDLIPPFPGTSGTGDGITVIEPGVMTVRPLPLGIAFTGAV